MIRRIALMQSALILLAVTGCTRAAANVGGSNLLPEQIAQTLTAAPTLPPSRTPPPTATEQPTFTPVPADTDLPTATATTGPSPTASPPPLSPDDPRQGLNLSVPDLNDDFQVRYGWYEFNDASAATILWERGQLSVTDNQADGFLWWSTSGETASNFYAEISASVGDCQGKDLYGLAVRIGGSGYDRGYTLEISCDGHYRMRKFRSGNTPEIMSGWSPVEAINDGGQAENRIGFLADGDTLVGFINGQQVEAVKDLDFVFGNFGLFAEAVDSSSVSASFQDFALWYVTQQ